MFLLILLIILACASGAYASISGNALYYFGVPLFAALTLLRLLWLLTVGRDSAPQSAAPAAKATPQSVRATQPELKPINYNALGAPPMPNNPAPEPALAQQPPTAKPAERPKRYDSFSFLVANTGTDSRQEYLRKIDDWEEPFDGCTFDVEAYDANGKTKIKVLACIDWDKTRILGYVPPKLTPYVEKLIDDHGTSADVQVVQGLSEQDFDAVCTLQWSIPLDPDAVYEKLKFKVVGVTFEGRQDTLKQIASFDVNAAVSQCVFRVREYQGEPALAVVCVMVDGSERDIGMVPADRLYDVLSIMEQIEAIDLDIHGGQDSLNYGATCEILYKV